MSKKSKTVDLMLCLFLGVFGVHRFYEGKIVTGILYLLTFGFLGLGVFIDLAQIICGCRTDEYKLPIGKLNDKHGNIIKILSTVIAIILWLIVSFLMFKQVLEAPVPVNNYYDEVDASGTLENKYTKPGEYKVSLTEFKSNEIKI